MNVKGMIGLIAAIAAIGIALGAIVMIDGPDNGNGYGDRTHIKTVGELEPGDYNLYKVTYIDDKSEAIYEMEERFSMMLTDQDCSVDIYINDRYDHMEYTSPYYFIADFSASIDGLEERLSDEYGTLDFKKIKSESYETYRGVMVCDMYASVVDYTNGDITRTGEIQIMMGPDSIIYRMTTSITETNDDGSKYTVNDRITKGSSLLVES